MSTVKVSDLPAATGATGSDVVLLVQGGTTKKLSISGLAGSPEFAEQIRDVISAALISGGGVTVAASDAGDSITIAVAEATPTTAGLLRVANALGGSASAPTALGLNNQSELAEYIRDTVAGSLVSGANVTITPNDAGDTIVISSSGGGGTGTGTGGPIVASNITDSTSIGRALITTPDAASARTAIGAGTSNLAIGTTGTTAKAGDYKPPASDISDSTVVGRALITAISSAAARGAIGAGASDLAIGTTSTTAKAGDYKPPASDISDSTAVGRSLVTAVDAAAARGAIGAGSSNLAIGTTSTTAKAGNYKPPASDITDSTAVGRSLVTAADATAARTTVGAAATVHQHVAAEVTDLTGAVQGVVAASLDSGAGIAIDASDPANIVITNTYTETIASAPPGSVFTVVKNAAGLWPSGYDPVTGAATFVNATDHTAFRPTARPDIKIEWEGPDPSPASVDSGSLGMLRGVDRRYIPNG